MLWVVFGILWNESDDFEFVWVVGCYLVCCVDVDVVLVVGEEDYGVVFDFCVFGEDVCVDLGCFVDFECDFGGVEVELCVGWKWCWCVVFFLGCCGNVVVEKGECVECEEEVEGFEVCF